MAKTLYHNPRCSKSREALQILKDNSIKVEIKEYLKSGLNKKEVLSLKKLLNKNIIEFMRTKEPIFKELKLENATEDKLLNELIKNPILLERPIFVHNNKAVLARPPEDILAIV